jgi:circadian clock protein KaiC
LVFLDYVQVGGEVNRTLMILKARGSQHSNQYREFSITKTGIQFRDIYTGTGGMLTGVARIEQEYREELEARQREQAILAKKKEIESMRSKLDMEASTVESLIEKAKNELSALEIEDEISEEARRRREGLRTRSDTDLFHDQAEPGGRSAGEVR